MKPWNCMSVGLPLEILGPVIFIRGSSPIQCLFLRALFILLRFWLAELSSSQLGCYWTAAQHNGEYLPRDLRHAVTEQYEVSAFLWSSFGHNVVLHSRSQYAELKHEICTSFDVYFGIRVLSCCFMQRRSCSSHTNAPFNFCSCWAQSISIHSSPKNTIIIYSPKKGISRNVCVVYMKVNGGRFCLFTNVP